MEKGSREQMIFASPDKKWRRVSTYFASPTKKKAGNKWFLVAQSKSEALNKCFRAPGQKAGLEVCILHNDSLHHRAGVSNE